MSYIDRMLNQVATYWAPGTFDQYADPVLADPIFLDVRWQDRTVLFINNKGDKEYSRAVVYITQSVQVGGYLYLGESYATDPESINAGQILRVEGTPSVNGQDFLYKAMI